MKILLIGVLLLELLSFGLADKFVQAGANGTGATEQSPLGSIVAGIAAAAPNEKVIVLPGTYGVATSDVNMNFNGKPGIQIIGQKGPSQTIFTSGISKGFIADVPNIAIEGFTFTGTQASVSALLQTLNGANMTVTNCIFDGNSAASSLLVTAANSSMSVTDCVFSNNQQSVAKPPSNASLKFQNCRFSLFTKQVMDTTGGSITILNSHFFSNFGALSGVTGASFSITGTSFFNNSNGGNTFRCATAPTFSLNQNSFCGPNGAAIDGTCNLNGIRATFADSCQVCGGNGQNKNCLGNCFQTVDPATCPTPKTYFVSPDGTGVGTQLSPFGTIAQALAAAAPVGDSVVLGPGTYKGVNNTAVSLLGKRVTVKSTSSTPSCVVIDCENRASIAGFIVNSAEDTQTVIQGVTIKNCLVGAVQLGLNSGLTIKNSVIDSCSKSGVSSKGALVLDKTVIQNCLNNLQGGAVSVSGQGGSPSFAQITNCAFINNTSPTGAGVYVNQGDTVITNTAFISNSGEAASSGGALFVEIASTAILSGNSFFGNGARSSGASKAIFCASAPDVTLGVGNTFCGTGGNESSCPSVTSQQLVNFDTCSVCNGGDLAKDCKGQCFTNAVVEGPGCGGCVSLKDFGGVLITEPPLLPIGAIVGGAVGGFVLVVVVSIVGFFVIKKLKQRSLEKVHSSS